MIAMQRFLHENKDIKRLHEKEGAEKRSKEAIKFEKKHHKAERRREKRHHRSKKTEKRYDSKHKHIGFDSLAARIEKEYEKKGYSKKKAKKIGIETAGKVRGELHK